MRKGDRARRGFTLVELSVVMAVLAILSTMIISFTVLTSNRAKDANVRADFMDACTEYRLAVTKRFAEIDSNNASFLASVDDAEKGPILILGATAIPLPEGGAIDALTVTVQEPSSDSNQLLKIEMKSKALGLSESFVIASHCGATFRLDGEGGA